MSARAFAAEADAARLRAHIDAAGDGANLPALLDLYHDRAERAEADAARWRKVEPLIERLRSAAEVEGSDPMTVVDAAIAILAATEGTAP